MQILDHEESVEPLEPSDALVFVQRWHRASWTMSPPTEVLLKGSMPVNEIATALATQFGIACGSMKVLVAHPYTVIKVCDLNLLSPCTISDWTDPMSETKTLSEVKWHLTYGDCIIIQDEAEPLRALTSEEEQSVKDSQVVSYPFDSDYCATWWDDAVPAPAAVAGTGTGIVSGPSPSPSPSRGVAGAVGPQPRVVQRGIVIKTQKARELEKENNKLKNDGDSNSSGDAMLVDNLLCFGDDDGLSSDTNVGGCNILFGDVD